MTIQMSLSHMSTGVLASLLALSAAAGEKGSAPLMVGAAQTVDGGERDGAGGGARDGSSG